MHLLWYNYIRKTISAAKSKGGVTLLERLQIKAEIAGQCFSLNLKNKELGSAFGSYLSNGQPSFCIEAGDDELNLEKEKISLVENSPSAITPANVEFSVICRKLSEELILRGSLLFHGSAIGYGGGGYIFTAPSGTGKSTHTRLWRELLGNEAIMINDDKPYLKLDCDKISVCGSPWNGKHRLDNNITLPLKGIAIISRDPQNSISRLNGNKLEKAFFTLLSQAYRPSSAEKMRATLEFIKRLTKEIPIYSLKCNMDISAAKCSFERMTKTADL